MRKLLLLVVLLVAFVLVLPFSMGMMAKNRLTKMVNNINEQSPNVQVTMDKYNRGWLKSEADFNFTVTMSNQQNTAKNNEIKFTVREHITHGPVIFKDGVKFGQAYAEGHFILDEDVSAKINALFKDQKEKPTLDFDILIKLFGTTITKLEVPAFSYEASDMKGTFQWKGLQGKWKMSSNMQKVDGHMNFAGFGITSPRMDMQFANMALQFRQHRHDSGLWIGKGAMSLPLVKVTEQGQERFLMTDLSLNSESDIDDQLMSASVKAKLGKLVLNGKTFGPGEADSDLKNLDVPLMVQIRDKVNSINNANVPPGQRRMMALSLMPMLPKLLDKGAEYQLNKFEFQFPEGLVKANGYAKVLKPTPDNNMPFPLGLRTRLEAQFDLSMPKELMKKVMTMSNVRKMARKQQMQMLKQQQQQQQQQQQSANDANQAMTPAPVQYQAMSPQEMSTHAAQITDQQISLWLSNGMLKEDGDSYTVNIVFKAGNLLINGAPPKVGFLPVPGAKVVRAKRPAQRHVARQTKVKVVRLVEKHAA